MLSFLSKRKIKVGTVRFKKRVGVVCLMAEKRVVTIPATPVSSYFSEQLPQVGHWWGSELEEQRYTRTCQDDDSAQ
jgi:hypothetical protein